MEAEKLRALFVEIERVVRAAGALLLGAERSEAVSAKDGRFNFVTKYDKEVQRFLIERFSRLLPEARYLCEEGDYTETPPDRGWVFVIDPIDGTTNFICSFPSCAVCVGLALDGALQLGVVYNPFRDECFTALRGRGAWLNGRALRLADKGLAEGVLHIDINPYRFEGRHEIFLRYEMLSYHSMDIRSVGSAALGILYVACGRCCAYISSKLCAWDYAGAALVLEEAGGVLTDGAGLPPRLRSGIPILAAAPKAQRDLLRLLAQEEQWMRERGYR